MFNFCTQLMILLGNNVILQLKEDSNMYFGGVRVITRSNKQKCKRATNPECKVRKQGLGAGSSTLSRTSGRK